MYLLLNLRRQLFIIVKHRTEPLIIEGLRAAILRLDSNHSQYSWIQSQYASRVAGFIGEKQVDKVFQGYTFKMKHKIFNGLSLTSSAHFQIDSLFLTPSYAVVFETKNLAGAIKVKENPPQLVQTLDDGRVRTYVSPIVQVQKNMELLRDWFYDRHISLPIFGAVVLAFSKKEVHLFDTEVKFLYPSGIPSYIRKIPMAPHPLDEKSFHTIIDDLIQNDAFFTPTPIHSTYSIPKEDFLTGVACQSCKLLSMSKYKGGWYCTACGFRQKTAHHQALRDWFLLFGGKITNRECRAFLHLPQRNTATRILKSMDMHIEGKQKNRTYSMKSFHRKTST